MLELLLLVLSKTFVMKMWKEVFNVDDGDIRLYNDPEHREFLASVMKGEIPQELRKEARGGDVTVGMEDQWPIGTKFPKFLLNPSLNHHLMSNYLCVL